MFCKNSSAQQFPNPVSLSTGQGQIGDPDPIWQVSQWFTTNPPNPIGLAYTPAVINNNCAPGAWIDPASLPAPVNNGKWITGPGGSCTQNFNDGYIYFRLTLDLPADCNGNSVATAGNYTLDLMGYVDNTISNVFVNGRSTGISGGNFAAGGQLLISLTGPWVPGLNYVDVQVLNFNNNGLANPYGLLLVANSAAITLSDGDNDGVTDINDLCPCTQGLPSNGCPPPISGTTSICQGQSTTLTAAQAGTYLWGDGSTGSSITVSPSISTSYSLTITPVFGAAYSGTTLVTVNTLPVASVTPIAISICAGGSTTLTASGGTSYAWSNSANTAGITISPIATTLYTVTVTDANTCSATATSTVTVNPLPIPAINPSATAICIGTNATLTASGGTSYAWSNTANTAAITVSPTISTPFTVTVTDANSCSATATSTVTVNPTPTPAINPSATAICTGNNAVLTASGGTSYAWSNSANAVAINVSPTVTTTYTVTVTDANSCSATATSTVTVNPLPTPVIHWPQPYVWVTLPP